MTGSARQTRWANTLRVDLIAQIARTLTDPPPTDPAGVIQTSITHRTGRAGPRGGTDPDAVTALYVRAALTHTDARWWIERRDLSHPPRPGHLDDLLNHPGWATYGDILYAVATEMTDTERAELERLTGQQVPPRD